MSLIRVISVKKKYAQIIDLLKSNKKLHDAVFSNEYCKEPTKKGRGPGYFSLLDDLKIVMAVLEFNRNFYGTEGGSKKFFKNTSFVFKNKDNLYVISRILKVCEKMEKEDIEILYQYIKDNPNANFAQIRSFIIIREARYSNKKDDCNDVERRTKFKDVNKNENLSLQEKRTKKLNFLKRYIQNKNLKRLTYENFSIAERISAKGKKKLFFNEALNEEAKIIFEDQDKSIQSMKSSSTNLIDPSLHQQVLSNFIIESYFDQRLRKVRDATAENFEDCQEFIDFISEEFSIADKKEILELLEKVSGNGKDLIEYLNTKDEKILWTKDEDEILKSLKSKDDFALKLITHYKGKENIKKRLAFKSLILPFSI